MNAKQKQILKLCNEVSKTYRSDFAGWVSRFINFTGLICPGLTNQQKEIASALVTNKNICVAAGGGIGKSALAALAVLWFLSSHPGSRVPTTAPSRKQLKDVLWAEIAFWLKRCELQQIFELTSEKLYVKGFPEWYAVARTVPKQGNAEALNGTLAGFHGKGEDDLMIVVDEACHDDETEVLTQEGWKHYHELTDHDLVLTINPATEIAYYEKPSHLHVKDYDGEMYEYESRTCNFKVTPKHKMLYKVRIPRQGRYTEFRTQEVQFFDTSKKSMFYMERRVNLKDGVIDSTFNIPNLWTVGKEDFSEFLGWYLSEGWINSDNYPCISQQNANLRQRIVSLASMLGFEPKVYGIEVRIHNSKLGEYLAKFGKGAFNKVILPEVKQFHKQALLRFLMGYSGGDGHIRDNRTTIYTMSKVMADDLQEIIIKAGYYASIGRRHIAGQVKWIKDHFATTSADDYCVYISYEPRHIEVRQNNIKLTPYNGKVWCLSVPGTNTFYVRRNGQTFWSHNSDVPDPVFTALEGALTSSNSLVFLISNPVSTGGYYYDTISDPDGKGRFYKVLYFDARDSELVSKEFEERIIARYGKDHAMYRAKVLGMPISMFDTVVVAPENFDKAVKNNRSSTDGSIVLSIDVGGKADKTVFCHKQGLSFIRWDVYPFTTEPDIIREVIRIWENHYKGKKFTCVIDALGKGSTIYEILKEKNLFNTIGHEGSTKANNPSMHSNKRVEVYYNLHKNFPSYHFPVDPPENLKKELANLKFDYSAGPIRMEEKKKFIARLGFSPDHADAMAMAEAVELTVGSMVAKHVPIDIYSMLSVKETRSTKYGMFSKFLVR